MQNYIKSNNTLSKDTPFGKVFDSLSDYPSKDGNYVIRNFSTDDEPIYWINNDDGTLSSCAPYDIMGNYYIMTLLANVAWIGSQLYAYKNNEWNKVEHFTSPCTLVAVTDQDDIDYLNTNFNNGATDYTALNGNLYDSSFSNVAEGEVVFFKGYGVYQKRNGVMTNITQTSGSSASANVGDLVIIAGSTNPDPTRLLLCDGSTYDTTVYTELYDILGSANVPDLRKKFLRGAGTNATFSSTGFSNPIALREVWTANGHAHTHAVTRSNHSHGVTNNRTHNHSATGRRTSSGKTSTYPTTMPFAKATGSNTRTSGSGNATMNVSSGSVSWTIGAPTDTRSGKTFRTDNADFQKRKCFNIYIRAKV